MTDPASLGAFIRWARATYGGNTGATLKSVLSYIGHGVALAPATDISPYVKQPAATFNTEDKILATALISSTFPVPGGQDIHPGQLTDQHPKSALLSPYALAEALRIATNNGENPLTVLDIVHCFGGTIEEFYELSNANGKPVAEVMIGSPNYTYYGPTLMSRALTGVRPDQSAREMATTIVAAYEAALVEADQIDGDPDVDHPRIIIAVESSKIRLIKQGVDALAGAIIAQNLSATDTKNRLVAAHQASQQYDTTTCDLPERKRDWSLTAEDGLSDLADFAQQLQVQFTATPSITMAAGNIISAVETAIITSTRTSGTPWFVETDAHAWTFDARNRGIALYTDFQGITLNNQKYIGWQAHWYTTANEFGDNLHPYAFVQGDTTWADVLLGFWKDQLGQNSRVKTIACSTELPEVRPRQLYMPVIMR